MPYRPRAVDLYCGAGGISQGLIDAGFDLIWALDNDEKTKITFEQNHGIEMTLGDIREIPPPKLGLKQGELDILVGGPPCPTFSLVGRTKINSLKDQDVKKDERFFLYENFLNYVNNYRLRRS